MEGKMRNSILKKLFTVLLLGAAAGYVSAEQINISELVINALAYNPDIMASVYDKEAQQLKYESALAGALPSIGFTTDTGNNPLYRYSNSDEFSSETYSYERIQRHKTGGGINLGIDTPTGGNLSLSGTGNLDFSLAEGSSSWNYLAGPALSLYFRQPLFTDRLSGSALRFDNMKLTKELAGINLLQAGLNRTALENNIIIAIVRTAVILNNLRNTSVLLNKRLDLARARLDLAVQDEQAGRLSSLDRLAEELTIRRQQEALVEFDFQIQSAARELENLTGLKGINEKEIILADSTIPVDLEVDSDNSAGVLSSEAVKRSLQLAATVVQNGTEPVIEITGLLRNSAQDASADLETAINEAFSSDVDLSISMAVSFTGFDWGEISKKRESDKAAIQAAEQRSQSARASSKLEIASAMEKLALIEEKYNLLKRGLEYDESLIKRETLRLDAGLSSELSLETILLDRDEREYQIRQLNDEKQLAILELYNTGGIELRTLFDRE
jgi:outer membrane protein TolC